MGGGIGRVFFLSPADDRISFKKILCMSIEKGGVSAAFGSRFLSRIKMKGIKKYPFSETEYPSPDFLTSCLSLARAELGAEGCRLMLGLPKAWAVVKTVDYPVSVLENLSNVIAFELDRITPFTPENAYYDFRILNEEEGKVSIAVAAARADLIDPYLKAIQGKGFKIDQISINLLGLSGLGRYIQRSDGSLFIEIDENQYEGILYLSNSVLKVFSGNFPDGDEKTKAGLIRQEIDLLKSSQGEMNVLKEVIFYLKDKNPSLKKLIDVPTERPVKFLDESEVRLGSLELRGKQVPYAAVGGVLESLWTKSLDLNLLLKGVHKKSKPPWIITAFLILALGVLLGIYWFTPIEIEKKRLQNIESQIASKKVEIKKIDSLKIDIEAINKEVNVINDFKQTKPLSLKIMKELTLVLPKNSWLTRMRVSESQINIEGYAPSATFLIPRLEQSNLFKKVEFSAPTFRDPRQNMDRFQIKMEMESPVNEKK
jgi:Tfp pilus assembly protein PilN